MTEVGEVPQFADVLVRPGNTPPQLENIARFLASEDLKRDNTLPAVQYETLAGNIPKYSKELQLKYPQIPQSVLDSVMNITFGPVRIPEGVGDFAEGKESEPLREASAKMQHAYAHHIIAAGRSGTDPAYANAVFPRIALMEYLARRPALKERQLSQFWSGVKSEVAVIKALERAGYKIEIPDYVQETTAGRAGQVLEWDVRNGIDMIASKNGNTLLVDSKGRVFLPNGNIRTDVEVFVEPQRNFPPDLSRRLYRDVARGSVKHATIIVPSHHHYLSGISSTDFSLGDKSLALRDFATSARESDIIEQVREIQFKK